jgi:coenzyme PQQ biosynthesis protein PqqD
MRSDSSPTRRSDVLAQVAGETVVLLTPDSGEYFTLNEVGGRIWELADGTRSVAEIAGTLAVEYDAPVEEIEADAIELLHELTAAKLLDDER